MIGYPGAATFHELLSEETVMVPTITSGMVSGYRMKMEDVEVLQSDVTVTQGNSGGPMIDASGKVVAVVSFGSLDPTGRRKCAIESYFMESDNDRCCGGSYWWCDGRFPITKKEETKAFNLSAPSPAAHKL